MLFDLFNMDGMFDPLFDALHTMYNESPKSDLEMLKLTKNNRTCYVGVIKCPGVEKRDINIEFSDNDGEYFPTLRVKGSTKTHLGTYTVDVGATICLPDKIRFSEEGTILKNGILYVYFEPDIGPKRPRVGTVTPTPPNEDFDI